MKPEARGIRLPDLPPLRWLPPAPPGGPDLAGRVVLVDFWDYSCVNCLRALPYLKAWHERYRDDGLLVLGLHAPEFPFAREAENVERAVAALGIPYAVALDSDFLAWQAFHNRLWPARYLFDAGGQLRDYHFGEGDYEEGERAIQEALAEIHPERTWPAPLAPLRPEDRPGAVCRRATPELYLGLERARLGNAESLAADRVTRFVLPGRRDPDRVYAEGPWRVELKHLESAGPDPAALSVRYQAAEVNLVMGPDATPIEVEITLDGRAVAPGDRGDDVAQASSGITIVRVAEPRLYRLVRHPEFGARELRVGVESPGLRAYAFTFVSAPLAPGEDAAPPPAPAAEPPA